MLGRNLKPYLLSFIFVFFLNTTLKAFISDDNEKTNEPADKVTPFGSDSTFFKNNLISNSDFEHKNRFWILGKHNGVSAILNIDTTMQLSGANSARVQIKESSGRPSDLQLFQTIEITKDSVYSLSFLAKVNKIKNIIISIDNGFDVIYQKTMTLKPGQYIYGPYRFAGFPEENYTVLTFNLGEDNTDVLFDHFSLNVEPALEEDTDIQSSTNEALPETP